MQSDMNSCLSDFWREPIKFNALAITPMKYAPPLYEKPELIDTINIFQFRAICYSHSIVPQCPNCLSLNAYLNFPALLAGLWSARSLHY